MFSFSLFVRNIVFSSTSVRCFVGYKGLTARAPGHHAFVKPGKGHLDYLLGTTLAWQSHFWASIYHRSMENLNIHWTCKKLLAMVVLKRMTRQMVFGIKGSLMMVDFLIGKRQKEKWIWKKTSWYWSWIQDMASADFSWSLLLWATTDVRGDTRATSC